MRISDWSSYVCSSDLWLKLGSVGTVGNAATAWGFSDALGKNPYLVTSGGGVWQGCAIGFATVTELTPDGPVDRGSFTDGMSPGAGPGPSEPGYEGRIVAGGPATRLVREGAGWGKGGGRRVN